MHKPESVQENGMHKILWDIQIQIDHSIPFRKPGLVLINKKKITCCLDRFWCSIRTLRKSKKKTKTKKRAKNKRVPGSCQRTEKAVKDESDGDSNYCWKAWNGSKGPRKESRGNGDQKKNLYYYNQNSVLISNNISSKT